MCGGEETAGGSDGDGDREVARVSRGAEVAVSRFGGASHPDLPAELEASVSALGDEAGRRFRDLAVFEGRGPVPAVVVRLWQATAGMDEAEAGDVLRMLARRSLVDVDPDAGTVVLHGPLFDRARAGLPAGLLAELRGLLADDLLDRWVGCPAGCRRYGTSSRSTRWTITVCRRWWRTCSPPAGATPSTSYSRRDRTGRCGHATQSWQGRVTGGR